MPVVEVSGVTKSYEGGAQAGVQALRGVDLTIEKGEFMAIAGPSGSGKTTLLNLIGGLDNVTSGTIRVNGHSLSGLSPAALADLRRDQIGFVFQAYNLIPVLTAAENAEYVLQLRHVPKEKRRATVARIFERLGIAKLLDVRPPRMSGGQQQRVAVARAIASEPAVVLADEPTANLDQATGRGLMELMRELNREHGTTFVFSSHDPMVLEKADRVVHLVDGLVTSDERAPGAHLQAQALPS